MNTHTQTQELIKPILDCFGGADGGVSFVKLKVYLERNVNKDFYQKDILLVKEFAEFISEFQ